MTPRLLALLPILTACYAPLPEAPAPAPDVFTLAARSNDGVVALTWDGAEACSWRSGEVLSCFDADSADAAVWGWDEPAGDAFTSPRLFGDLLDADQIAALDVGDLAP